MFLDQLEDHVVHVKSNAIKAESEIKSAEKDTRSISRKLFWLFMIICFVVVSIVLVMLMIFLPDSKK